ncbi:hypothetical protein KSP39_PZI002477 [Platanthera zijinensis]|uniref:Uncharacterized protein n=1 Tax=Platanthera zijinensis TaxID=2320716 RepID=A0AAP0BZ81_9ASPA
MRYYFLKILYSFFCNERGELIFKIHFFLQYSFQLIGLASLGLLQEPSLMTVALLAHKFRITFTTSIRYVVVFDTSPIRVPSLFIIRV